VNDAALDRLYWWRQGLAAAVGLVCGLAPITGLPGFLAFLAVVVLFPRWALRTRLFDAAVNVDLQYSEGLAPASGTFLCIWVLVYSSVVGMAA
jgi:hypothetical protein